MSNYESVVEYVNDFLNNRVSVVRCKDCKHRPLGKDDPNFWEWYGEDTRCPWFCADTYYLAVPPDDFFCAYGEVKDEL